jgi:hypothetical protein
MNQNDLIKILTESTDLIRARLNPALFSPFSFNEKIHPNTCLAKTGMSLPLSKNHNQGR